MISTERQPTEATTPIQWAVTSTLALTTALVQDIDDAVIFDDLKEAFESAKDGTTGGGTLMVWGLHGPRDVIAIAHNGHMFFAVNEPKTDPGMSFMSLSEFDDLTPDNRLTSAFPYVIPGDGPGDFQLEPGLTKREWMAAMAMQGLLASEDPSSPELGIRTSAEVAALAIDQADVLLERLGPTGSDEF
jgi:hypothetical protein